LKQSLENFIWIKVVICGWWGLRCGSSEILLFQHELQTNPEEFHLDHNGLVSPAWFQVFVAKLYVHDSGVFGPSLSLVYFLSIDSARSVACFCSAYNIAFSAGELQLDVVFSTLSSALSFFSMQLQSWQA